ncbi:MAG: lipoprotein-releasing system transmembrane subunit LolC [Elusimicrobia bacterium CG08_land_8_20_14_0_20_59_10]|nr:MAG: lipoprotein-releasing system transmembrane subunit LolC [Elusimicrobia bacterium CG08_land_8_20_14_0_20_59_10]
MSTEFFIARRYLLAKRKGLFTMITTLIGVAGVALGVAALIVTLAIMNGFQSDIKKKIIDAQAHLTVYGRMAPRDMDFFKTALKRDVRVAAESPFILGQAILTFDGRSTGVVVRGFDPALEFSVNNLKGSLVRGSWDRLEKPDGGGSRAIVLGEELARHLGLWLGDEAVLVSPQGAAAGLGLLPKMKKFKVVGMVRTGYYEFDNTMAYCSIATAGDFFGGAGGANGAGVKLKDINDAGPVAAALRKTLGAGYSVKTYADMNQTLFAALKLEKFVMSLVLALIILVATFNIASNLLMMSVEKLRDIGILRALGAGPAFIRAIFFWEGNLIALTGIGLGVLLGIGISVFISVYPVVELPSDIYYITKVPVSLTARDLLLTAGVSYVLCMLSTVYPALRASKISPVDAIRYG